MTVLKGKPVADGISAEVKAKTESLSAQGKTLTLAIVRVGTKPDDIYYEAGATKRMKSVGIDVRNVILDEKISEEDLIEEIKKLNEDEKITGVLLLMPLPKNIDGEKVKNVLLPEKDIDGLTNVNMAKLYAGDRTGFAPCTPSAVMELLRFYGIDVSGKNVVIVGRSLVVGKPLSMLMLAENATVTVCHSKSKNIREITKRADILVAAVGRAKMINKDYVSEGTIVIDVGINNDENGNMCGDVDFDDIDGTALAATPVPGGIGSITTSILAKHIAGTR